jgi:predicted DNA-binding protein
MAVPKTEPITVRIPTELKRSVRDICHNKGIDMAQYIRELIERDLNAKDMIPAAEKKHIDRAVEAQTRQIIAFLETNIADKISKIYYNMGTKYDQAAQKSEDLCAYMAAKFEAIKRGCPDKIEEKANQYRNEFMKSENWDETYAAAKKDIDNYVSRCDCLYKTMDTAAEECKKADIINIFASRTLNDWRKLFGKHVSDAKDINYNAIFDTYIKPHIIKEINQRESRIKAECESLEAVAGIRNSAHEDHVRLREHIISQLRLAENIDKRKEELKAEIRQKNGVFGKLNNMTLKRLDRGQKA